MLITLKTKEKKKKGINFTAASKLLTVPSKNMKLKNGVLKKNNPCKHKTDLSRLFTCCRRSLNNRNFLNLRKKDFSINIKWLFSWIAPRHNTLCYIQSQNKTIHKLEECKSKIRKNRKKNTIRKILPTRSCKQAASNILTLHRWCDNVTIYRRKNL
jgi:hypothetical protein